MSWNKNGATRYALKFLVELCVLKNKKNRKLRKKPYKALLSTEKYATIIYVLHKREVCI